MEERVRYRAVLANQEFRSIYLAQVLSLLGDELARIALAVLVYRRTDSALATSATWAVSYLAYLASGPLLAGLSDRYPRLTVMVISDLLRAPIVLALCIDSLSIPMIFVLIALLGALAPPFDSARSALQPDLLDGEAYVRGNALMNVTIQVSQIAGFVLGGTLVAVTSVRGALGLDAATFLISAGILLHGVRHRAAAQTVTRGVVRDMRLAVRLVTSTPELRRPLQYSLLSSLAVIGTEGLAVLVAHDLGGGPKLAGLLTATAPAGFLLGSVVVLRLEPERRIALMPRLVLLSCLPLLLTPLTTSTAAIAALWVLAGAGVSVNLVAGPYFMQQCPREVRARAYGVASTSLWAAQGLGLLAAGALAGVATPRQAVALIAAGALLLALPVLGLKKSPELSEVSQ